MKSLFATLLLTAVAATNVAAQEAPWRWQKVIAAGQVVDVRAVIGNITATAASGNQVEIVATKSARRSDPASVEIKVVEHAGGVVICTIYESSNDCDPDHKGDMSSNDNDTRVDFEVRVPRGVKFYAQSVTGDVSATGLSALVSAGSVSGDVRVSTTDIARASSVSGSINARMGRSDWEDRLAFSTVSGDITLEFAGDLNTDVSFNTVSGNFDSDWPVSTTTSRSRNLRGTIGKGGRRLTLSTVSGSVELRKAN